jgi:hypothetical protein
MQWTDLERAYILANAAILIDREIAANLTRITGHLVTLQAVRDQRLRMGLRKARGRRVCRLER